MEIKKSHNHKLYIKTLRRMTANDRLLKSFELTEFSKSLFLHGLKKRFPFMPDSEIVELYLKRLDKCHNKNY